MPILYAFGIPGRSPPKSDRRNRRGGPRARGLRVLVAEDNTINQKLMRRWLEVQDHQVTVVENGKAAVAALAAERFDVALLDVEMPEMDGLQAARAIRLGERRAGGRVPLIVVTAYAMKGDRERCLQAGFDAYISKPVLVDELYDAIDRLAGPALEDEPAPRLSIPSMIPSPPASDPSAAAPKPEGASLFDSKRAMERAGGDADLVQELVEVFQTECPRWLSDISGRGRRLRRPQAPARRAHAQGGRGQLRRRPRVRRGPPPRADGARRRSRRRVRGGGCAPGTVRAASAGARRGVGEGGEAMVRVLVVDDSAIDRRLAGSFLRRAGMEPTHAHNGVQALESIERSVPDIVVTDLQMPEMDGLELVEAIRRIYPSLPVILMTAHGSEEIAVQALQQRRRELCPQAQPGPGPRPTRSRRSSPWPGAHRQRAAARRVPHPDRVALRPRERLATIPAAHRPPPGQPRPDAALRRERPAPGRRRRCARRWSTPSTTATSRSAPSCSRTSSSAF